MSEVFNILRRCGIEARLVGGCVRDYLIGRPCKDIDFAVQAPPEQATEALTKAGARVYPTGLKHGTITAVIDVKLQENAPSAKSRWPDVKKTSFELTSLRRDVVTDGRHASVAFTNSWHEDAERRDFTFNAMYVDQDGKLYDFFGGLDDLANGVVRFIGDPEKRIREDYLRILRYYRFFLRYGKSHNSDALSATKRLQEGLTQLSIERVQAELFEIITASGGGGGFAASGGVELSEVNIGGVLKILQTSGIIETLFGVSIDLPQFLLLLRAETIYADLQRAHWVQDPWDTVDDEPSNFLWLDIRLFCLFQQSLDFFKTKFCLPRHKIASLKMLFKISRLDFSEQSIFMIKYRFGSYFMDMFFILHIRNCLAAKVEHQDVEVVADCLNLSLDEINEVIEKYRAGLSFDTQFPIQGQDLVDIGIPAGKELGKILGACEQKWITRLGEMSEKEMLAVASDLWGKKLAETNKPSHS
ncbi:MAG: CCA tRNA nucleotidyltransferase [Holosporales bacterium]|nr:CCA tRNA nucleotidyltransferase [Holosporales bacterium]